MPFITMKPGTLLAPVPVVMVSCADECVAPNIITLAWVGTVNSDPPMVSVSVRPERYSHGIIEKSREFVVNLVGEAQLEACDFCGVRSGRDTDKWQSCKLTPAPADGMRYAPAIAQCPGYLACRVRDVQRLGSHDLYIGEVVSVGMRDDLLDESGKLTLSGIVSYNHGVYYAQGAPLGFFGYSVAAQDVKTRRMRALRQS